MACASSIYWLKHAPCYNKVLHQSSLQPLIRRLRTVAYVCTTSICVLFFLAHCDLHAFPSRLWRDFVLMANRLMSRKLAGGLPSLKSCFSANGFIKGLKKGETGTSRTMAASAAREVVQEHEVERNIEGQRKAERPVGRGAISPFGLLDLWHPFLPTRNLRQLLETVDGILEEPTLFAPRPANVAVPRAAGRTPWDVLEDNEGFHLRVDLPGLSKDEVKVSVEENELVIQAEHTESESKWKSRRGASTYFARLKLPENAELDHVKAELKNGVLDVTVPKKTKADPKKVIDVQVS